MVGKNESGKTAFLQALRRLNPTRNKPFNERDHYPRWIWKKDQRNAQVAETIPIEATFELNENEIDLIEKKVGDGIFNTNILTASRNYKNELAIFLDTDELTVLKNSILKIDAESLLRKAVSQKKSLETIEQAWIEEKENSIPESDEEIFVDELITKRPNSYYR